MFGGQDFRIWIRIGREGEREREDTTMFWLVAVAVVVSTSLARLEPVGKRDETRSYYATTPSVLGVHISCIPVNTRQTWIPWGESCRRNMPYQLTHAPTITASLHHSSIHSQIMCVEILCHWEYIASAI